MQWEVQDQRQVWLGLGAGSLVGIGGALHAQVQHLALWPTVVTWLEWAAAILMFPLLFSWVLGLVREKRASTRIDRVLAFFGAMRTIGIVLFIGAIALRVIFGLGWKPF